MTSYHSSIDASGAKPDASTVSGHFGCSDFFFFSIDFLSDLPDLNRSLTRRSELLRKWSAFFENFLVSEARYSLKIVHKNSGAILLIMPMLNIDLQGRSFRNRTPAFLFLRKLSARFDSDRMRTDHVVTAEFGLLRRLDALFKEQAQEQQMLQ